MYSFLLLWAYRAFSDRRGWQIMSWSRCINLPASSSHIACSSLHYDQHYVGPYAVKTPYCLTQLKIDWLIFGITNATFYSCWLSSIQGITRTILACFLYASRCSYCDQLIEDGGSERSLKRRLKPVPTTRVACHWLVQAGLLVAGRCSYDWVIKDDNILL